MITPERWDIETDMFEDVSIRIVDVQGVTIATVWIQPEEEHAEDNAKLIAGAPRMFELLKQIGNGTVEGYHVPGMCRDLLKDMGVED